MTPPRLTLHAERRRIEFGYTIEEVHAVASDPHIVYPGDSRHGPDRTVHQRGRLASVHGRDGTIITLMPSGAATRFEAWSH